MRIAIIDLGTNTFNLLIADLQKDKSYKRVFKTKIAVKLGEGGINNNYIEPIPFKRGIKALKKHKKTIEEYGVERIVAFATSAIRSASNGKDFVQKAKEKAGLEIHVISGDREAELIYHGIKQAVKLNDATSLIIDIGGGSTEFIIANKDQIFWKHSFLLGAARLLERIHPSDPMTDFEATTLENYLLEELEPLFKAVKKYPITEMIGSSGSFDSLAEMIAYKYYDISILKGITEYSFSMDDCYEIYLQLLKSTNEERKQMKGLIAMRVDMMVISAIFVHLIITKLGVEKMRLSRYSLKEGILAQMAEGKI
jgi:exopolyphosphatase/guanosine-5'-triphosphate,3'-diphosphate pyrophosphatase